MPNSPDFVADNATLDGIVFAPLRLRFQLSCGDRWTSRMELDQNNAVEVALKILAAVDEFGAPLTKEQRLTVARIATGPVHLKRQRAVTARYDAGEITIEEAKRLSAEMTARCGALTA